MFPKCHEDQEVINITTSSSIHFIGPIPNGFVTFEIVLSHYKESALVSVMYHNTHLSNNPTDIFDTFGLSANGMDLLTQGQFHQYWDCLCCY